ncbi:hypothetical protein V493_03204 [Pseudogymnoascus sp. VKM F-4281 (FW-2241)]|nr:hypothetical protein V493_03204 [Pseudogymnoascus sp. VKM F-4281 (FW-2241)]
MGTRGWKQTSEVKLDFVEAAYHPEADNGDSSITTGKRLIRLKLAAGWRLVPTRFFGKPALMDWLAGEDTNKSGGREEANDNDHGDMISYAAEAYNWNVGSAKQVTIYQAQRELAKHQRKFGEDLIIWIKDVIWVSIGESKSILCMSIPDSERDEGKGEDSRDNVHTHKERHPCLRHGGGGVVEDGLVFGNNGINPELGMNFLYEEDCMLVVVAQLLGCRTILFNSDQCEGTVSGRSPNSV